MNFKIYNSDFGVKVGGIDYQFTHVMSMTVETTRTKKLIRGANEGNKMGLSYIEGSKEPDRLTVVIADMSVELKAVLDAAYEADTRLDVYCIDRSNGSSKMSKNAILTQLPMQRTVDDSPESINVEMIFESFDMAENFKS